MTEQKRIEATLGPYRGQNLDVDEETAAQAIADNWARDPFAPPGEPIELSEDDRMAAIEAAEKAAKKLRGEEDAEDEGNGKPKAAKTREMEAGSAKPYTTRDAAKKK